MGKNGEKVRRECLEKDERCGVEGQKSVEWSMREKGFGGWGDERRGRRSDALGNSLKFILTAGQKLGNGSKIIFCVTNVMGAGGGAEVEWRGEGRGSAGRREKVKGGREKGRMGRKGGELRGEKGRRSGMRGGWKGIPL